MRLSTPLAFLASMFIAPALSAASNLAEMWKVTPKPEQRDKFESALKNHIAHRMEKGDTRTWKVYVPVLGDDLGHYIIRSCCDTWAEQDNYRDWQQKQGTGKHWQSEVSRFVDGVGHHFSEVDFANSNWPEDDTNLVYFSINEMRVKPGHGGDVEAEKKIISDHSKAMNWEHHWLWSWNIGGESILNLVTPHENYADLEYPVPSFAEALADHLGSADAARELLQQWASHFDGTYYRLYRLREDLSMKDNAGEAEE